MGARADAIQMFKEFRADEWFADAFYPASWTEVQTSGGGAFGGGTTVDVIHSATCVKSSDKDTITQFGDTVIENATFIKGLIDEIGLPPVDTDLTFNSKNFTVVNYRTDPTEAIVSIQLKS